MSVSGEKVVDTKAGHAAAIKVGGVRKPARVRKTSDEGHNSKTEDAEEVASEETTVSKSPKPQIVMWGQVRDQQKDYPSQAVQHMQQKPQPTHEPSNKPMNSRPNIIQQPRKC